MDFRQAYDPVRALSSAWNLILRAPLALVLGGLLLLLTEDFEIKSHLEVEHGGRVRWRGAEFLALWTCFGLAVWLFHCVILIGFANAVRDVARTGKAALGGLVDPRGRWFRMVFATLFQRAVQLTTLLPLLLCVAAPVALAEMADVIWVGIVVGVGLGCLILPLVIYVFLGVSLTLPAVALEGLDPVQALRRSWRLVDGQRFQLLYYHLVMCVVILAGLLLCCFGILGTSLWARTAWYECYARLLSGQEELLGPETGSSEGAPQAPE